MAARVVMPKMGLTMEEGSIVKWHKEEGEQVRKGELLLEILTDKATMEVEAPEDGVVAKIMAQPGQKVKVGKTIALIALEGEDPGSLEAPVEGPAGNEAAPGPSKEAAPERGRVGEKGVLASPYARKLAREMGLDLNEVEGSGPGGRIIERDVTDLAARREKKVTPLARKMAEEQGIDPAALQGSGMHGKVTRRDLEAYSVQEGTGPKGELVPFTPMRRIIADRMEASAFGAPHVTLFKEVDAANLVAAREQLLKAQPDMIGLSYTVLIAAMAARALEEHPQINACIEGDGIRRFPRAHVGIAVALEEGLVVPVLHNTAELGLKDLAARARDLFARAQAGTLLPDEMKGGTFTVSSLGSFGIDGFTPIINQPESAILGLGRIVPRPAVVEGQVVVRPMMTLSLSFDHRVVDGVPAARFLNRIAEYIQEPLLLLC